MPSKIVGQKYFSPGQRPCFPGDTSCASADVAREERTRTNLGERDINEAENDNTTKPEEVLVYLLRLRSIMTIITS